MCAYAYSIRVSALVQIGGKGTKKKSNTQVFGQKNVFFLYFVVNLWDFEGFRRIERE